MHPYLKQFCHREKPLGDFLAPALLAKADLNARDEHGVTAMGLVIENASCADWCWVGLEALIQAGADPNVPLDSSGQTVMHRAYLANDEHQGQVDTGQPDMWARWGCFQNLLLAHGATLEATDSAGRTPLSWALMELERELHEGWLGECGPLLVQIHWLMAHGAQVTPETVSLAQQVRATFEHQDDEAMAQRVRAALTAIVGQ